MATTSARTYADIDKAAPTQLRPWTAQRFPEGGVFGVTANILGVITNYFLTGPVGGPTAVIVGRVEMHDGGRQHHYLGHGLKGGTFVDADEFHRELSQLDAMVAA